MTSQILGQGGWGIGRSHYNYLGKCFRILLLQFWSRVVIKVLNCKGEQERIGNGPLWRPCDTVVPDLRCLVMDHLTLDPCYTCHTHSHVIQLQPCHHTDQAHIVPICGSNLFLFSYHSHPHPP